MHFVYKHFVEKNFLENLFKWIRNYPIMLSANFNDRRWILQLCEKTGLSHDYIGTQLTSKLMWLMPENTEMFKDLKFKKIVKYSELYSMKDYPELFTKETLPKIMELDSLADKINELIYPLKPIGKLKNTEEIISEMRNIYNLVCQCYMNDGKIFARFGL